MKLRQILVILIFLTAAGVRAVDTWRPVDVASWREIDMASVARNFYRGDMNILYPQIDWRGDGPGHAEMELPLYPWSIAVLYKIFGFNEILGRYLAYLISLLTVGAFYLLCRELLPPAPRIVAFLAFATSPMVFRMGSSMQPDGPMLLAYILAAYLFQKWLRTGTNRSLVQAGAATAMSILFKASAAHIGVMFALLGVVRHGWGWLIARKSILFALIALIPPAAWYWHAHGFWLDNGLSLGISNESHWFGFDLLTTLHPIKTLITLEVFCTWLVPGAVLGAFGVFNSRLGDCRLVCLLWLVALAVFYLLTLRTSADWWAIYYHIVSVPAAALLAGLGVDVISRLRPGKLVKYPALSASTLILLTSGVYLFFAPDYLPGCGSANSTKFGVLALAAGAVSIIFLSRNTSILDMQVIRGPLSRLSKTMISGFLLVPALLLPPLLTWALPERPQDPYRICATQFVEYVPAGSLLVGSGGRCRDATGKPIAYNDPHIFYWLDSYGWNTCIEDENLDAINGFAKKGAHFYAADRANLIDAPEFAAELRARYPLLAECEAELLFDIRNDTQSVGEK